MPTKILAIDDSKTMRLAIKIAFAAEDAEVTAVSKGSDAVARAKQMAADVVLLDVTLGDGEPSGYEICRQLKADSATAKVPVIMMGSHQKGVDEAELSAAGADGAVTKPFETQELLDKVAEVTGNAMSQAISTRPAAAAPRPAPAAPAPARPASVPRPSSAPPPMAASSPTAPAARPAMSASSAPPASTARSPMPNPPSRPSAPASPVASANIPIAIPIPFTSADAPTSGMLQRLQQATNGAGQLGGLDPKVAEAIVALSREVIEQVVWEVVPDLAEAIIKQRSA
jgi:CheY-like chemotaxis protein